jgi:molybdopterin synthase catalytic subunit
MLATTTHSIGVEAPGQVESTVELRERPIDVGEAVVAVQAPDCGGIDVFIGAVRADETAFGTVVALDYEAYAGVAEKVIRRIVGEAAGLHDVHRACVLHRVGRVPVGDFAVVVAVGAAHRAEAFAATQYVIDALKAQAPIWKREITERGGRWVTCADADSDA